MKRLFILPLCFLAFSLAASGTSYAEGNAENGASVFKKNCSMCHNKDGSKSSMSKAIVGSTLEVIQTSLKGESTGLSNKYDLMVKTVKKKPLSEGDIADIAAFLNQ